MRRRHLPRRRDDLRKSFAGWILRGVHYTVELIVLMKDFPGLVELAQEGEHPLLKPPDGLVMLTDVGGVLTLNVHELRAHRRAQRLVLLDAVAELDRLALLRCPGLEHLEVRVLELVDEAPALALHFQIAHRLAQDLDFSP